MIGKKINQLATELAPASTDLTIIGNPTTGVSKKITLAQLGAIFSGAVSFYTNYAAFPTPGTTDVIYCAKDTQKLYLWSGSAYVEVFPSQALLDTYQLRSEKGNANGYASLDSTGKVPVSQLPSSIMEYKGTWSAATNTPTLANGTGDTGDVYICNAAGSVNFGAGAITFAVGDYVIYSGSIWQRSSGAVGTVTSVAASITGNAIGITGSPVTTSGTLALAFAGTSAQYVNGAGNLVTFPSIISQAQNIVSEVYNNTGATLTKGTIVYINGGQGNLPTVTKALATSDSTSAQTYGIVQADITNMNNGYVVVTGRLIDLDTQAYSNGTQLYLSGTTAGTWTSTKPYAPIHLVYVGIVVRSHPTQGVVEVKIQNGYELDEIHNVAAQTPINNDGLFWEASTSLWKNKSIATVLGYTPQAQLNGTGFVKASGTTITYDNSTYLTTSVAATTYLPMVLSSTAKSIELNGQTFDVSSVAGSYTSGRLIVTPTFTAIGYQSSGVFKGLQISTDGTANFYNTGLTRFFNQVQFDSTLTNGTYTYTLPGATGTLALTSDIPSLSGYVPYTGATTNLNLGSNNLTAAAITGSSARITTLAGSVYADVNGNLGTTAGTQNTIAYWGSQYSLASLSTTTYPDLTELSYVKGVTSSIQTQLNSKQSTLTNPVTGTGTTNYLPKFTGTSTIGNSIVFDNGSKVMVNFANYTGLAPLSVKGNSPYNIAFEVIASDSNSAIYFRPNNSGYNLISSNYLSTSPYLPLSLSGRENNSDLVLTNSGLIGIGTTSPIEKLTSNGLVAITGASVTSWYVGNNNAAFVDYNSGDMRIGSQSSAGSTTIQFYTTSSGYTGITEKMRLNASGNLSIGNTNDTYKLDVSGTGRFSNNVLIEANQASSPLFYAKQTGTSGYTAIQFSGNNGTDIGALTTYNGNIYFGSWNGGNGSLGQLQINKTTGAATFSSSVGVGGYGASYSNLESSSGTFGSTVSLISLAIKDGTYNPRSTISYRTQTGSAYAVIFDSGYSSGWAATNWCFNSGSVGIGTTSPGARLVVSNGGALGYEIDPASTSGTVVSLFSYDRSAAAWRTTRYSSLDHRFEINGTTEAMRITSGGNVLIGTTTANGNTNGLQVNSVSGTNIVTINSASIGIAMRFFTSTTTQAGYIIADGSTTSYVTSSDYRLKQNLQNYNGIDLISKIKTYDYEWKANKTRSYGVLAHELQEIIPQAVYGIKDGKEMQGVDYSKIVPVLIKAIQEQQQQIEQLK